MTREGGAGEEGAGGGDTGPRGPGWLAFEAGQKNGSRTRRMREREGEGGRGGEERRTDPLEEDRARARAGGEGCRGGTGGERPRGQPVRGSWPSLD